MATGLGIDVGAESIKVVQARVSGGSVTVTAAFKIPRKNAATEGLDMPEEASGPLVLPENLGMQLKTAGLGRTGTLGVSGRDIILKYLSTPPIPPEKLKMFIDMEIGEKLPGARSSSSDGPAITYDYRLLNVPSGLKGDLVIMTGVAKNEYLYGVSAAMKNAGLIARQITPSSFGLVNAYLRTRKEPTESETVVLVDIGHELLEIAIIEGNHLYFARSAPGGGKKFTAALDKVLKVGTAKATEFKHERARLYPEGAQIPNKQELMFQSALKEGAENISGAIRSSVMFCRTQAKMPKLDYQRVIISGGGARLAGLREYLEKKIGRPVQVMDLSSGLDLRKMDAVSAKCFEGEVPDMTIALGLAIVDADPDCFHFALLPEKVKQKQIFWRKTVFGIGAAALVALGVIIPISNSSKAIEESERQVAFYEKLNIGATTQKKQFQKAVQDLHQSTRKTEYYARQTRMGRVYLNLFAKMRAETPKDIMITWMGPRTDNQAGGSGNNWSSQDAFAHDFTVLGHYDSEAYPDTKFNTAWEGLRTKLLQVPGVDKAMLIPMSDAAVAPDAKATKSTSKEFQLRIQLKDEGAPLVAGPVVAPAPKSPAVPAAAGKSN